MKRYIFSAVAALGIFILSGCHHPFNAFPEEHPAAWTPSEVENMLAGDDPLEGFNRSMFSCTDFLMCYVADPLGRVYTTIFPRPFIDHFDNVCVNLEYPARLVSSLLQAEWQAAGTETLRFLSNSTLGIVGIFDVARAWWHIPPAEADFGQAFAKWGIGPGESFMLPVAPTLNGRDLIGLLFDTAFDLKTYIPYAGYATFLNRMTVAQQKYDQAVSGAIDPYKNFRQLMAVRRELTLRMWFYKETQRQIEEFKKKSAEKTSDKKDVQTASFPKKKDIPLRPADIFGEFMALPDFASQGSITDSIRSSFVKPQRRNDKWYLPLSLFNSDFLEAAKIRKVEVSPDRPKIHYSFWAAPEVEENAPVPPEKLVIILPGIGGSCTANTLTALAEKFHDANMAVAGLDSTFHWRFVITDEKLSLPGYLPQDAQKVRQAIQLVISDLKKRQWIKNPEIILCGYSMGGLQALKLADMESAQNTLEISRFIAINPPVSSEFALNKIDELVSVSANWNKNEMLEKLVDTAGKLMMTLFREHPQYDPDKPLVAQKNYQLPISPEIAKYVVGLSLKMSMREMLLAVHRERALANLPEYSWFTRNKLYLEIDKISFQEYAYKYLAPEHPEHAPQELMAHSHLSSLENTLKNASNIRIFHAYDDFLLDEKERKYLDTLLKSRIVWFSNGGHLGSLYYSSVLDKISEAAVRSL